jgi:DNA-binding PadR family transcriptional regulator
MSRTDEHPLLLGEWACLGILVTGPAHGFAIAARLRPEGDVGRVWSLSRPLTYRAIDQLVARGLAAPTAHEPGIAGGTRTIMGVTSAGRTAFEQWLVTPVLHLRDIRSELLLKLVLAELSDVDVSAMLDEQRRIVAVQSGSLARDLAERPDDVVRRWRAESADAALRFLDGAREHGAGHQDRS